MQQVLLSNLIEWQLCQAVALCQYSLAEMLLAQSNRRPNPIRIHYDDCTLSGCGVTLFHSPNNLKEIKRVYEDYNAVINRSVKS